MVNTNTKFDSVSYPVINVNDSISRNIVDAKITAVISSVNFYEQATSSISVVIEHIDEKVAKVRLDLLELGTHYIYVPIFSIDEDQIPDNDSYILIKQRSTLSDTDCNYILHPDCLIVMCTAPRLSARLRFYGDVVGEETENEDDLSLLFIDMDLGSNLSFINGNNVTVSGTESNLIIEAGEGIGDGVFEYHPSKKQSPNGSIPTFNPTGLRSINGITSVSISSEAYHPGLKEGSSFNTISVAMDDEDNSYDEEPFTAGMVTVRLKYTQADDDPINR